MPEAKTQRVQFMTLFSKQHHTFTNEQLNTLVALTDCTLHMKRLLTVGFSRSDITALTKDAVMGPL